MKMALDGGGIEGGALGSQSLRPDLVRGRLRYEECLERDGSIDPGRIKYCDGPVRALSPLPDSYTRGRQFNRIKLTLVINVYTNLLQKEWRSACFDPLQICLDYPSANDCYSLRLFITTTLHFVGLDDCLVQPQHQDVIVNVYWDYTIWDLIGIIESMYFKEEQQDTHRYAVYKG